MAYAHSPEEWDRKPNLMVTQCLERKSCQGGVQGRKLLENSGAEGMLPTMRLGGTNVNHCEFLVPAMPG